MIGNDLLLAVHLPLQGFDLQLDLLELRFVRLQAGIVGLHLLHPFHRGIIGRPHCRKTWNRAVPGRGEDGGSHYGKDREARNEGKFVEFRHG